MNIEGITLLNQFVEYSPRSLVVLITIILIAICIVIGMVFIERYREIIGSVLICGGIIFFAILVSLSTSNSQNITNYPDYTHYIIQINDKTAWSEIAPNYIVVKEVYPNTGIYEIKRECKEGDEQ